MSIDFGPLEFVDASISLRLPKLGMRATDGSVTASLALPRIGLSLTTFSGNISLALPKLGVRAFMDDTLVGSVPLPKFGIFISQFARPDVNVAFIALPSFGVLMHAAANISMSASLALPKLGLRAATSGNVARLRIPHFTASLSTDDPAAAPLLFALQSPGYVSMLADAPIMAIDDAASAFVSELTEILGLAFGDTVTAEDVFGGGGGARSMSLNDLLDSNDALALIGYIVCSVTATATTTLDEYRSFIMAMTDAVLGTDALVEQRGALAALADMLTATDLAQAVSFIVASSTATATVSTSALRDVLLSFADTATATSALNELRGLFIGHDDTATATDALSGFRHALLSINDSLFVGGRFVFDGVAYSIYAMQPVGAAMSTYTGLEVNSFFELDGVTYGMTETGVVRIDAPTDEGSPIQANIFSGLSNLNSTLLKAVPYVYVGLTRSGALLLKVTSMQRGVRKENWYKLNESARDAPTNERFQISKKLHSNYFGFTLSNIDGEDFDVDFVKGWVMRLNRRIS